MKKILKYFLTYIIMITIFILSIVVISLIPSEKIYENIKKSSLTLLEEGDLLRCPSYRKIKFDNYTDSLMLNNAYSINNKSPFESAMLVRENYIYGISAEATRDVLGEHIQTKAQVKELEDLINNNPDQSHEYARYWHGYLVYLRPLLLLFDYSKIRIIILIVLIFLILGLLYNLYKLKKITTLISLTIALICVDIQLVFLSLQSMITFVIMLLSSNILIKKINKNMNINLFFFIIGGVTCFFDLLTTPLITLGIPLILYLELTKEKQVKKIIIDIIKISLSWGIGYLSVCITKWVIVDIFFERNVINTAIQQFFYRSDKTYLNILGALIKNLTYTNLSLFIIISSCYLIFILNRKKGSLKVKESIPYFIIMNMPIIWYIILSQHSDMHSFFTYRLLSISFFAIETGTIKLLNIIKKESNYGFIEKNNNKKI